MNEIFFRNFNQLTLIVERERIIWSSDWKIYGNHEVCSSDFDAGVECNLRG